MTKQILLAGMLIAMGALLSACQTVESEPPPPTYDGAALYQAHCASCHGATAAGDGPMAKLLVQRVPDLRAIGIRNKLELIEVIDGRGMRAAHGTPDMPVWGWAFREEEQSENDVRARLSALADYLLSIQPPR